MNNKLLTTLSTAAIATATLASVSDPAHAYQFGTNGMKFDQNTRVDFGFTQSMGWYQSTLQLFKVNQSGGLEFVTNLFEEVKQSDTIVDGVGSNVKGTCGNTVLNCSSSYVFEAGVEYTLGLKSVDKWVQSDGLQTVNRPTVYTTNRFNNFGGLHTQQAVFDASGALDSDTNAFPNPQNYSSGNPFAGPLTIGFDDRGNMNDVDFQDFVFTAKASVVGVPEPASILGLGLVSGLMALSRRNQKA